MEVVMCRAAILAFAAVLVAALSSAGGLEYTPAPLDRVTGVGVIICRSYAATATSGTSEEILATCTIPAGKLATNGSLVRFVAGGLTASNGNTKLAKVRFGGIDGVQVAAMSTSGSGIGWRAAGEMVRLTASTQIGVGTFAVSTSSSSSVTGGSVNLTADTTLVVTATTASAAGDVTLRYFYVEYFD